MAKERNSVRAGRGDAGRTGEDVRSDLRVTVQLRSGAGLVVDLMSKVDAYYGESIRAQIHDVLSALGVENAEIDVTDHGALPFVIAARVEAAVVRTGHVPTGDARPSGLAAPIEPSNRDRMRRSRLYIPGNEPKLMVNAGLHGADAVILDLEDSVHPDAKDEARLVVRNALRCVDFGGAERMVRINQLPLGIDDLAAVVPEQPELILIPKVEDPSLVEKIDDEITRLQQRSGDERPMWLMPILESALGIENAFEIACASDRVAAVTIGLEDYTADLGVLKTRDGAESAWARARLVNAARAAGVQAIDSVYGDFGDNEGLLAWAVASRAGGFDGMGCIHPAQIAVIHQGFAPGADEIDRALRIVAAFKEAEARGVGVVSLGSKMIDAPVVERARRLVAAAQAVGLVADAKAPDA